MSIDLNTKLVNTKFIKTKTRNTKGCWYFIYLYSCPVCGSSEEYRERKEGPKPKHWSDCHSYEERHCGCMYG